MPDRLLTRFSCGLVCELEKPNIHRNGLSGQSAQRDFFPCSLYRYPLFLPCLLYTSRMFSEYGRQKGWERENPATDLSNPSEKTMDGIVEVTEQMELPF